MDYKDLATPYHMDTSTSQKSNLQAEWERRAGGLQSFNPK
jgi:hypothetical protein